MTKTRKILLALPVKLLKRLNQQVRREKTNRARIIRGSIESYLLRKEFERAADHIED